MGSLVGWAGLTGIRCSLCCQRAGLVKKVRILLADDHIVMLAGLRAFLERQPNLEVVGVSLTDN